MQDRFKFRIFEYETKEMVELDAIGYSSFDPFAEGKSRLIMVPSGLGNTFHYDKQCLYDNDKFSEPMQCTGLKDKNGKLIYEGDILKAYFENSDTGKMCFEYVPVGYDEEMCKEHPKCFYKKVLKQLKAKEQECETLASQLDFEVQKKECLEQECEELKAKCKKYGEINEQETKDYAELKAENEELKKLLKVRIEDLCDSCGASSMMPMPCKVYEKTLTEIKEIAENAYCLTNGTNKDMANFAKQILQKISECEGNDEKR